MKKKSNKKHICPRCKGKAQWEGNPYRPFCSKRCKLIDFGQWAAEQYRIPGEKLAKEEVEDGN